MKTKIFIFIIDYFLASYLKLFWIAALCFTFYMFIPLPAWAPAHMRFCEMLE